MENFENVIPLGLLQWGIYPDQDDKPIIYMYKRPNGETYLYKTKYAIEVNLSRLSEYDTQTLFTVTKELSVKNFDISQFESRSIVVNKSTFDYVYTRPKDEYVYFLVPAVFSLFGVYLNNVEATSLFKLQEIYSNKGRDYYVYRSLNPIGFVEDLRIQTIYDIIERADLDTFLVHISDISNPHRVTKEQIGLGNVDNTSDEEKPIPNKVLDRFEKDEQTVEDHLANKNNPHDVTLEQILGEELSLDFNLWKEGTGEEQHVDLKLIRGTSAQLEQIPIVNRQLLFDTDKHIFYIDNASQRIAYGSEGIKVLSDVNANTVIQPGVYRVNGTKQNFPTVDSVNLNLNSSEFILGVSDRFTRRYQTIILGSVILSRYYNENDGSFSAWQQYDVSLKQDTTDNSLTTTSKTIVGAINEIKNGSILSSSIKRIEFVGDGFVPVDDDTLYIQIPGYLDGIDFMQIQEQTIIPPFRVG